IMTSCIVFALEPISMSVAPMNDIDKTGQVLRAAVFSAAQDGSENFDKRYIELLEKVNQQTSLLYNPYNTIIAILAFLVAVGSISFALMIYRQGKDYREQRDSAMKAFLEQQEKLNEEVRLSFLEKSRELEEQVKLTLKEAQKAEQSKDQPRYDELKEKIDSLMKQREDVQSQSVRLSGAVFVEHEDPMRLSFTGLGLTTPSLHRCSQCKFGFRLLGARPAGVTAMPSNDNVQCPKCGNVDLV
ncbi:MAG: hypothetical protein Q7S47_02915, partial [bacterium]|nr:hypothetical protein [bacterium]